MLRKLLLVLIFALVMPAGFAMPACASEPTMGDARAHDSQMAQRKRQEQGRPKPADAPCVGCVAPCTLKRPLLEAPAPGLLMIPASFLVTDVVPRPVRPSVPPPKFG